MIYVNEPAGFNPRFDIVSCFLQHDGRILLLHRLPHKSQGSRWGVPAGKVDEGESPETAILRELEEETGIALGRKQIRYFKTVFVRHDIAGYDFVYHIFHAVLPESGRVVIRPSEHEGFSWVAPEDALKMHLVEDLAACIKMFFSI